MPNEEILRQRSQIAGGDYERCDLCHQLYPASQLRVIAGSSRYGEYDETMRVCDACARRIYRGELDVEYALNDDDERYQ